MAEQNNPTLAQAAARVQAAQGEWLQSGLYPNPRVGYQANEINDDKQAGQQGGFSARSSSRPASSSVPETPPAKPSGRPSGPMPPSANGCRTTSVAASTTCWSPNAASS